MPSGKNHRAGPRAILEKHDGRNVLAWEFLILLANHVYIYFLKF